MTPDGVVLDAVILAGGRSSRLGGRAKAGLVFGGRTLLERTVDAASLARRIVVVGDQAPPGTLAVRETPAFGGPAAGIAAGLSALAAAGLEPDAVLVLACDMPRVSDAVPALLAAVDPASDGVVAVDASGRLQFLAGVYWTSPLAAAVAAHADLTNLSVRALLASLALSTVTLERSTDDIDTWSDAARFGIIPESGLETR